MRILPHRGPRLVAALVVAALTLTGCSAATTSSGTELIDDEVNLPPLSEITPADDPTEIEGPTHALIGGPTLDPELGAAAPVLPTTVTSHDLDGNTPEVTITDTSRIIALSITGTLADYVHALGMGDQLVGRDIATSVPGSEDLPVVTGTEHTVNIEGILVLEPSLVLTDGTIGPDDVLRSQLRDAGIAVVSVERIRDFDTSYQAARDVGAALGLPQQGEQLATAIEDSVKAKESEIADTVLPEDEALRPRVVFLYIRGTKIYYMFGEGSGIDTLIEAVGAQDIATEQGWKGERPVTPEALIEMNPDVILVMSHGLESVGGVDEMIATLSGVAHTKAGQNRRIIDIDDKLVLAGGTHTADVLDGLARALYAPQSLPSQ